MISFVYLDVGGVAIVDFSGNSKWDELYQELGITPDKREAFGRIWDKYILEICTTRDIETLVPILKKELSLNLPPNYSLLEGFAKRFEPNPSIWPVVKEIKSHVPVGLLTNMYHGMFNVIEKSGMLPPEKWDVVVDSSIEGHQKPEAKIFEIAEAMAGVPGKEILFADNSAEHVEAAKDFGWQTFLYDSSNPKQASDSLLAYFNNHR